MDLQHDQQLKRLERLIQDTAGWHVLLLMQPPGDVAFLAPFVPALRGYEIVAADPSGKYDLWRRGKLVRTDMTVTQVSEWLREHTPSEEVVMKNGAMWLQSLMTYYHIPPR